MEKDLKQAVASEETEGKEKKGGFCAFLSKNKKIIIPIAAGVVVLAIVFGIWGYIRSTKISDMYTASYQQLLDSVGNTGEDNVAVKVDDVKISTNAWKYYLTYAAEVYAAKLGVDISEIDWNKKDENGEIPLEKIKSEALLEAMGNATAVSRAKEWGIELSEEDLNNIDIQLQYCQEAYGENVYDEIGVTDEATFREIFENELLRQEVIAAVNENPEKYISGVDLSQYISQDNVTVKIVGVQKYSTEETTQNAKTKIDEIKARLDNGEDFDKIWVEQYEDITGVANSKVQTETIVKGGTIRQEIQDAAFALKVNEISGIIDSESSYVILMRTVGEVEIENYLMNTTNIKINKNLINGSEVK